MAVDLSSYLTVAQRIAEFRSKYPEGSLQPVNLAEPFKIVTIGDKTFITYSAAAYRKPDDPMPGIGVAWEAYPGRTPYTRDSELMNAETSAWGRAIVAALASDTSVGIATQDEIRNRQEPGAETNVRPLRRPANIDQNGEKREAAKTENFENLLNRTKAADSLDSLRQVFQDVGNSGLLGVKLDIPEIVAGATFQEYLIQRSDELGSPKSNGGSLDGTPGKGNARPPVASGRKGE